MTRQPNKERSSPGGRDQLVGASVEAINDSRHANEAVEIFRQDEAFRKAIEQVAKVREFLSRPSNILGNDKTKHGEIAEQMEVHFRNARDALRQQDMTAVIDGVSRTGSVDYFLNGVAVQSKFINGIENNIRHVIEHLDKYPSFTNDGSYYSIPKDSFAIIETIRNGGAIEGLSDKTQNRILELIRILEQKTGKPFEEACRPALIKYSDPQIVQAPRTVDREIKNLKEENKQRKSEITDDYAPSVGEALEVGAIGAGIAGSIALAAKLYAKHSDGKNMFRGDFTEDDWREVGLDTLKGAAVGFISAEVIYTATNYANVGAPVAASFVSAANGVASLAHDYWSGELKEAEFADLSFMVCFESALMCTCSTLGQTAIPIPILGAVVGTIVAKLMSEFLGSDNFTCAHLEEDLKVFRSTLDEKMSDSLNAIVETYDKLDLLSDVAFDPQKNASYLANSVFVARAYGVPEGNIIKDTAELDSYMSPGWSTSD